MSADSLLSNRVTWISPKILRLYNTISSNHTNTHQTSSECLPASLIFLVLRGQEGNIKKGFLTWQITDEPTWYLYFSAFLWMTEDLICFGPDVFYGDWARDYDANLPTNAMTWEPGRLGCFDFKKKHSFIITTGVCFQKWLRHFCTNCGSYGSSGLALLQNCIRWLHSFDDYAWWGYKLHPRLKMKKCNLYFILYLPHLPEYIRHTRLKTH